LIGRPNGKRQLERPRRRWGIILKRIFQTWDGEARTGSIWLKIETYGGIL
jgi:hypothetical protein